MALQYEVKVSRTQEGKIIVQAENAEHARELAEEMVNDDEDQVSWTTNGTDIDDVDVIIPEPLTGEELARLARQPN